MVDIFTDLVSRFRYANGRIPHGASDNVFRLDQIGRLEKNQSKFSKVAPAASLQYERAAVNAAEAALERARDSMRAAAKERGMSCEGLFGDSIFVRRSFAEEREERAHKEGYCVGSAEGQKETIDAMTVALRATRGDSPFSCLRGVNFSRSSSR
jgi:flagellar biosynthesis/type III secretory pathway protein FliH